MSASGNVRVTQIRSSDRKGTGTYMHTGTAAAVVSGNVPMFNASGDLIDSGEAAADIGGSSGSSGGFHYTEAPPTSSWSWTNQNSAVVNTVRGALSFRLIQRNGTGGTIYSRAAPGSTPWTLTARLSFNTRDVNFWDHAIIARESSTGKFVSCGPRWNSGLQLRYGRWSDPATLAANTDLGLDFAMTNMGGFVYLRLTDDGTDLISYYGDGENFFEIDRQGRTAFMAGGANELGLFMDKNNSAATYDYITLISWKVE